METRILLKKTIPNYMANFAHVSDIDGQPKVRLICLIGRNVLVHGLAGVDELLCGETKVLLGISNNLWMCGHVGGGKGIVMVHQRYISEPL
jgi:hypothetical protein